MTTTKQKVKRTTYMEDAWLKAGWVQCPRSGVYYHPTQSWNGCGSCSQCIMEAKARNAQKNG